MRIKIGYPSTTEGREILDRFESGSTFPSVIDVACTEDIIEAQKAVAGVKVGAAVKEYIMSLIEETRKNEKIVLGVSPRGSISLMKACQAYAAIHNRTFVTPDDVKAVAVPVLAHRIMLKGYGISSGTKQSEAAMNDILASVPVPTEEL
jgi:MoxR-like ATPase